VRKVVTVLFCDLSGSTAIGERTDPEALRTLMNRYYETARSVLERHGGTVEKFVGDAVMAVFGIPVANEDDGLRAVRSAVELRDVVHALGLEARIGVNTGPVVAGDGDTFVTGDAVNVAARLEQSAGAGEILLGDDTLRLVRDAVAVETLALALKGKTGAVTAHRLVAFDAEAGGVERRLDRPMVGRGRELERLRADFAEVADRGSCRLFTLIGPAGVGKSRVVHDFLEAVGASAIVARSRALSYGEGITYWPLGEMLVQLGVDPADVIRTSPADTQLAARAIFEQRAEQRPLVLVLDDLHWAEPPMLDLVEHVVDWSRDRPIFVLCVARPELLDVRPAWGGGKLNATALVLEPLPAADAEQLVDGLLAGVELDAATRARILGTAEGNPLFLEEMASLARAADGTVEVPPTIQALLQSRLDALDRSERVVVDRGSVEGNVFHRGAVTALLSETEGNAVPGRLLALVRKEVVRPDRAQIPGEDAFRFRHLLIRETAYESLPKAVRAELHERFAEWLDAHGAVMEHDELVGYHLEQAANSRSMLDPDDPGATGLRTRACERLAKAGRAAFARGDLHGARNLLERATRLAPEGPGRRRLVPELVDALIAGAQDRDRVDELLTELAGGDDRDRATETALRIRNFPGGELGELLATLDVAQGVLADLGDTQGVARCEDARAWSYWFAAQAGPALAAYRRSYELRRGLGKTVAQPDLVNSMLQAAWFSGAHVDEIHGLLDTLEAEGDASGPLFVTALRATRARVDYAAGVTDEDVMRATTEEEVGLLEQTGALHAALTPRRFLTVTVPWLQSDLEVFERGLRLDVEISQRVGSHLYLANSLAQWAQALCEVGDVETALEAVARGRTLAHPEDVSDQLSLDLAEAFARALTGEWEEMSVVLDRAHSWAERSDLWFLPGEPDHIEYRIRALQGDHDGARGLLEGLIRKAEDRGFDRVAARYRRDLAALEAAAQG
jgi:class 3 adenylate cyclase/tetratricopeptide (TPR) repeat protein